MDPDQDSLVFEGQPGKPMMRCPWCKVWAPANSFIALQTPPDFQPPRTAQIYKHGGPDGCKMLFALGSET